MKSKPAATVTVSPRFVTIELPPDCQRLRMDAAMALRLAADLIEAAKRLGASGA